MKVYGFQKMTTLDYPGKIACTVFTGNCNFRCPYCHNASLVLENKEKSEVSQEEIFSLLKKRRGLLDGVAVTGGEPLINKDIPDFLSKIKELGYLIKLDTNGSNPELLKKIVSEKLVDRVAMDIKNSPELYEKTIGVKTDMRLIGESKEFLLSGQVEYEFRTTLVKGIHTKESIIRAAEWIKGAKEYYLQSFKDSGDLIAPEGLDEFSKEEIYGFAEAVRPYVGFVGVRGI
ncbi:MAG: anaerobic ribonucleoside-triphosphate reductase activating protein [Oscillospiraceae bacterium]|nr:anaerobic ribonucleoside-triphosphate reductase activating protein [Oscillospiraceae bacterium]